MTNVGGIDGRASISRRTRSGVEALDAIHGNNGTPTAY
jgi:hypothetical protein